MRDGPNSPTEVAPQFAYRVLPGYASMCLGDCSPQLTGCVVDNATIVSPIAPRRARISRILDLHIWTLEKYLPPVTRVCGLRASSQVHGHGKRRQSPTRRSAISTFGWCLLIALKFGHTSPAVADVVPPPPGFFLDKRLINVVTANPERISIPIPSKSGVSTAQVTLTGIGLTRVAKAQLVRSISRATPDQNPAPFPSLRPRGSRKTWEPVGGVSISLAEPVVEDSLPLTITVDGSATPGIGQVILGLKSGKGELLFERQLLLDQQLLSIEIVVGNASTQ